MKKILLLGGSAQQVVAIRMAQRLGYYSVLCDYLPDNPGRNVADKYYCVSTTDKSAILDVAKKENVCGIVAYASDPAAPTAAYVSEVLGLPSNSYDSVTILSEKHLFRDHLKKNGFNVPKSISLRGYNDKIYQTVADFRLPVIIKPVDSSGSKGISCINELSDLPGACECALQFSRNGILQIEEYLEKDHEYLVGGDIFVVDKKIVFWGLLNCHRDKEVNPLVPVGKSYPLHLSADRKKIIRIELQRLIDSLDIEFGAFNVELIFDQFDRLFFIELGPRNGGNMIPDLLTMISGKNMIEATLRNAMGDHSMNMDFVDADVCYATFNLHSAKDGILKKIVFSDEIEKYVVKKELYVKPSDPVYYFDSANKALGIIFLKFSSDETMQFVMKNITNYITVVLQ